MSLGSGALKYQHLHKKYWTVKALAALNINILNTNDNITFDYVDSFLKVILYHTYKNHCLIFLLTLTFNKAPKAFTVQYFLCNCW